MSFQYLNLKPDAGRWWILTPALVAAGFLLINYYLLNNGHPHEDAYILFVFSESFANGDGIRYFAGGPPAEGATDFLWMILLGGLNFIGIDIAWAAVTLNTIGLSSLAFLYQRLIWNSDHFKASISISLLFALILLLSPIAAASYAGFSTAFYTATIALLFYVCMFCDERVRLLVPYLGLLIGLIRPDGVIIGVTASLILLWQLRGSSDFRRYLKNSLIAVLLGGIYFTWRYNYFGQLLPLPLYVKSSDAEALPGLSLNLFWASNNLYLLLFSLATLVILKAQRNALLLATLPVLILLTALSFATQTQNVAFRFQAPVTAVLLIHCALLFNFLLNRTGAAKRSHLLIVSCAVIFFFGVGIKFKNTTKGTIRDLTQQDYINYFPYHLRTLVNDDTKIVLTEAGRMAYWLNGKKYDLVGLNTPEVAVNKSSVDYISRIDPDLIFIHLADTFRQGICEEKQFCQIDIARLEDYRSGADLDGQHWSDINNGVKRAPLVTYSFLQANPDRYRLVLAHYKSGYHHLYALKVDSDISWSSFLERLEYSYSKPAVLSYAQMKRDLIN